MTDHEQLLTNHLNDTAERTQLTFTIDDVRDGVEGGSGRSNQRGRFVLAVAACFAAVVGFAIVNFGDGSDQVDVVIGSPAGELDAASEVVVRSVEPNPSSDSYVWTAAFGIDELDELDYVNVGRMGPAELAQAPVEGREDRVCRGSVWMNSINCDDGVGPKPVRFDGGSPDTGAWLWTGLGDEAAIVRFTDQEGSVSWQRPIDGTVLFADTAENDDGRGCSCRFDVIDDDGNVIEIASGN